MQRKSLQTCNSLQKFMTAHINEHTSEKMMVGPFFLSLFEEIH